MSSRLLQEGRLLGGENQFLLEPPPSPGKSSDAKEAQNFLQAQLSTGTRFAGTVSSPVS